MPFWDWAKKNSVINSVVGNKATVQVVDPVKGTTTINNPLYSYKYQFSSSSQQNTAFPDSPFNTHKQTQRENINSLNQQLANNNANLRNRVYNLLTAYTTYETVSNKGTTTAVNGTLDSLESIHDFIHTTGKSETA